MTEEEMEAIMTKAQRFLIALCPPSAAGFVLVMESAEENPLISIHSTFQPEDVPVVLCQALRAVSSTDPEECELSPVPDKSVN